MRFVVLIVALAGLSLGAGVAAAQDATWQNFQQDGNWNNAGNWPAGMIPTGTATFSDQAYIDPFHLGHAYITFRENTSIGTIYFDATAPGHTFDIWEVLTINGAGIVNDSAHTPTFRTAVSRIDFTGESSAGSAHLVAGGHAAIQFFGETTADNATIVTENHGVTRFLGNSTGGTARLITQADGAVDISRLTGDAFTVGSIEGAGTYYLGSKQLTVGSNNRNTEVSGVITDGGRDEPFPGWDDVGGALVKAGSGTLTLSGDNTYTGGTTINSGVLQLGSGGTSGSLGTGAVVNHTTLAVNRSGVMTLDNAISGAGRLDHIGPGTTILTGANTYTGGTHVTNGAIRVHSDAALGATAGGLNLAGGTLQFGASFNLDAARGITLDAGGGTFDTNGFDTTLAPGVVTGAGWLSKVGEGTLTLAGGNTHTGGYTVAGGTLRAGAANAFAPTAMTVNGGTLDLNDFDHTTAALSGMGGTVALGTAALTVDQHTDTSYAGVIAGGGSLTFTGTGTLALAGANTYTGGTTISSGVLQVGDGGTTGSLGSGGIVNNATLAFDRADTVTFDAAVSGTGSLVQKGEGTLILTGVHTYTGGTTNLNSRLQLGDSTTTGKIVGEVVNSGNRHQGELLSIVNADLTDVTTITNQRLAGTTTSAETRFLSDSTAGDVTIVNNGGVTSFHDNSTAGHAQILNGVADGFAGHLMFHGSSTAGHAEIIHVTDQASTQFFGSSTAGHATIFTQAGITTFSGSSTGGQARLITDQGEGAFSGMVEISLLNTAGMTAGSIEGTGTYYLGDKQLTVGGNDLDTEVSGAIRDGGTILGNADATGASLVKVGQGTLTLSGVNTYTGGTTITGGTLRVQSALASEGTVTVENDATLAGHGSVGDVVVTDGRLSPGGGTPGNAGTLHTGSLLLGSEAVLVFELAGMSENSDQIAVAGDLNLDGTLQIINLGGLEEGQYTLLTYTGDLTGSGLALGSTAGGFGYSIDTTTPGAVLLHVVPEPASVMLLGAGLVGLLVRRRRQPGRQR